MTPRHMKHESKSNGAQTATNRQLIDVNVPAIWYEKPIQQQK